MHFCGKQSIFRGTAQAPRGTPPPTHSSFSFFPHQTPYTPHLKYNQLQIRESRKREEPTAGGEGEDNMRGKEKERRRQAGSSEREK